MTLQRARPVMFAVAAALCLGGCFDKRIRKANVDEVTDGMSKKQVESILGLPSSVDNKDWVPAKKTVYVYKVQAGTVTLTFRDDKLQSKESTIRD